MTTAWRIALMQRCDANKFPESPDELWASEKKAPGESGILAMAKAMQRRQEKEKRDPRRGKRRRAVTIHRPISE